MQLSIQCWDMFCLCRLHTHASEMMACNVLWTLCTPDDDMVLLGMTLAVLPARVARVADVQMCRCVRIALSASWHTVVGYVLLMEMAKESARWQKSGWGTMLYSGHDQPLGRVSMVVQM